MPTGNYTENDARRDHVFIDSWKHESPFTDDPARFRKFDDEREHLHSGIDDVLHSYSTLSRITEVELCRKLISLIRESLEKLFDRPATNSDILAMFQVGQRTDFFDLVKLREQYAELLGIEFREPFIYKVIFGPDGIEAMDRRSTMMNYFCPLAAYNAGLMDRVLESILIRIDLPAPIWEEESTV